METVNGIRACTRCKEACVNCSTVKIESPPIVGLLGCRHCGNRCDVCNSDLVTQKGSSNDIGMSDGIPKKRVDNSWIVHNHITGETKHFDFTDAGGVRER